MARNKIKIEKLEAIAARSPEQPPPAGLTEHVKDLIQDGLAHATPQNRESRSLAEILSDIESDKNKSRTRKDFEIYIAQMAERMTHSKIARPVFSEQSEQANESLPLFEHIKFLRERLN